MHVGNAAFPCNYIEFQDGNSHARCYCVHVSSTFVSFFDGKTNPSELRFGHGKENTMLPWAVSFFLAF